MTRITKNTTQIPSGYPTLLKELKEKIRNAQTKAAVAVNQELIKLYWDVGNSVLKRQERGSGKAPIKTGKE